MRFSPRVWMEAVARWAKRWSDGILGERTDRAPGTLGPPKHWLDRIRRKRPELLAGLETGSPLFRARVPGGPPHVHPRSGPAPRYLSAEGSAPPAPDFPERQERDVRQDRDDGRDRESEPAGSGSRPGPTGTTRSSSEGPPRRPGVARPPSTPRLVFSAGVPSRPSDRRETSWPSSPERRVSTPRWGRRPTGESGSSPASFSERPVRERPAAAWPGDVRSAAAASEPVKPLSAGPQPAEPRPVERPVARVRFPALPEHLVPAPPTYAGAPPLPAAEVSFPAPRGATGHTATVRWADAEADHWPELPAEDRALPTRAFEHRERERKLDLEQRGEPWNASPSS